MGYRRLLLSSLVPIAGAVATQAMRLEEVRKRGSLMCGISGLLELSSFQDPNTLKLVDYDIDICNDVAASFGVKPEYKIVAEAAHTFDALFGVGIAKDSPSLKEAINGTLLELEQTGKRNETWDGRVGKDSSYKLERTCKVVPVDGG